MRFTRDDIVTYVMGTGAETIANAQFTRINRHGIYINPSLFRRSGPPNRLRFPRANPNGTGNQARRGFSDMGGIGLLCRARCDG